MKKWLKVEKFLRPYLGYELLLLLLLVLGSLLPLITPYYLHIIIDDVFPNKNFNLLIHIILILSISYIVRIIVRFSSDYLCTWISNRIMSDISICVFGHILKLPLAFFHSTDVGDTVYRLSHDVNQIRHSLTGSFISMINNLITIIGLIILMWILSFKLFLLIILCYPFIYIVNRYFSPLLYKKVEEVKINESNILGFYSGRVLKIKNIKISNTNQYEESILKKKMYSLSNLNIKAQILISSSINSTTFILAIIPLIILWWGGTQVITDSMTIGTLIAFLQYANKLHDPFQNTVNLYIDLLNSAISVERVFFLLEQPTQYSLKANNSSPPKEINLIKFKEVTFSYNNRKIFDKLNIDFQIGKNYAIVGPSGCGKTTLLEMLFKLHSPQSGSILIDEVDLEDINIENWIKRIGISNQSATLFNDTIINNIKYGNFDLDDKNIISKLDAFSLFNDVSDLNYELSKPVLNLSGGQKQKVALARAIMKNKEILIIDEASSEIDSLNEDLIFKNILDKKTFKTVIVISHRLSTLKNIDEIIYFDKGGVLERGSYAELIKNKRFFYKLFEEQLR